LFNRKVTSARGGSVARKTETTAGKSLCKNEKKEERNRHHTVGKGRTSIRNSMADRRFPLLVRTNFIGCPMEGSLDRGTMIGWMGRKIPIRIEGTTSRNMNCATQRSPRSSKKKKDGEEEGKSGGEKNSKVVGGLTLKIKGNWGGGAVVPCDWRQATD